MYTVCLVEIYFIDIQTSKELIQININKIVTNGIFTMNEKHTQLENELNRLRINQIMEQT